MATQAGPGRDAAGGREVAWQALRKAIAAANNPALARKEGGMVHQVWHDGEITAQKSGSLLWQRALHTLAPPLGGSFAMPEGCPLEDTFAYVTYRDALLIRAAMSAFLGAPDGYGAAGELARPARSKPEEVGRIARRNAHFFALGLHSATPSPSGLHSAAPSPSGSSSDIRAEWLHSPDRSVFGPVGAAPPNASAPNPNTRDGASPSPA